METLTQKEIHTIKRLLLHSWKDIDFTYEKLTDAEKAIVAKPDFEVLRAWATTENTGFEHGDIVRAKADLDQGGANVKKGDLGSVIGEPFCDGENPNPLIQWYRALPQGVVLGGVCNAPPSLLEQVYKVE